MLEAFASEIHFQEREFQDQEAIKIYINDDEPVPSDFGSFIPENTSWAHGNFSLAFHHSNTDCTSARATNQALRELSMHQDEAYIGHLDLSGCELLTDLTLQSIKEQTAAKINPLLKKLKMFTHLTAVTLPFAAATTLPNTEIIKNKNGQAITLDVVVTPEQLPKLLQHDLTKYPKLQITLQDPKTSTLPWQLLQQTSIKSVHLPPNSQIANDLKRMLPKAKIVHRHDSRYSAEIDSQFKQPKTFYIDLNVWRAVGKLAGTTKCDNETKTTAAPLLNALYNKKQRCLHLEKFPCIDFSSLNIQSLPSLQKVKVNKNLNKEMAKRYCPKSMPDHVTIDRSFLAKSKHFHRSRATPQHWRQKPKSVSRDDAGTLSSSTRHIGNGRPLTEQKRWRNPNKPGSPNSNPFRDVTKLSWRAKPNRKLCFKQTSERDVTKIASWRRKGPDRKEEPSVGRAKSTPL